MLIIFLIGICAIFSFISLLRINKFEDDILSSQIQVVEKIHNLCLIIKSLDNSIEGLRKEFLFDLNEFKRDLNKSTDDILCRIEYSEKILDEMMDSYTSGTNSCIMAFHGKMDDSCRLIIQSFQEEKKALEQIRANRSKETFKNLHAAFSATPVEKDEA